MAYQRKTKLNLVSGEERSLPSLVTVQDLVKELDKSEQETVLAETTEFYRARQNGMMSYLGMGQHLARVRDILEPHELWKKYASSLPNMGQATAYRMIWAWENANRTLPEATVRVAAREGFRLISSVKGDTFTEPYAKAVKKVERQLGPAPNDEVKAGEWLRAVQTEKRKLSKAGRPKDARKYSLTGRVKRVVALTQRIMVGLPDDRQRLFLDKVIEGVDTLGKKRVASVAA